MTEHRIIHNQLCFPLLQFFFRPDCSRNLETIFRKGILYVLNITDSVVLRHFNQEPRSLGDIRPNFSKKQQFVTSWE